jgi:polyhydroxyalkanoate synthesis repressor PhaR
LPTKETQAQGAAKKTRSASKASNHAPAQASAPAAAMPGGTRIIKKYPNRRLYDTNSSAYITLAEVKQLVVQGHAFVVLDAKTNEELTRSILLQIILEEESGGLPMFSEAALANMIRFYGHAMQGFMGSYLEKNVQAFTDMQTKMTEQGKAMGAAPAPTAGTGAGLHSLPSVPGMLGAYAEQSQTMFAKMQEQMQKQTEQMFASLGLKR